MGAHDLSTLALVFSSGACVGSFMNVVVHRVPIMRKNRMLRMQGVEVSTYNLAFPASACPSCNHQIRWFENIPLFSYLYQRGRCSACGSHISRRYPLIEALGGILFLSAFIVLGACL